MTVVDVMVYGELLYGVEGVEWVHVCGWPAITDREGDGSMEQLPWGSSSHTVAHRASKLALLHKALFIMFMRMRLDNRTVPQQSSRGCSSQPLHCAASLERTKSLPQCSISTTKVGERRASFEEIASDSGTFPCILWRDFYDVMTCHTALPNTSLNGFSLHSVLTRGVEAQPLSFPWQPCAVYPRSADSPPSQVQSA